MSIYIRNFSTAVKIDKQHAIDQIRSYDFLLGVLIGLPLAFPREPFYILSFLAFGLTIPRMRLRMPTLLTVGSMLVLALLSNMLSPSLNSIGLFKAIYTSAFFGLFLFGFAIRDVEKFFQGFCAIINVLSIAVIVAYFATAQYVHGISIFIYPVLRLWGFEIFPDWPNFFGFLISLGLMINWIYLGHRNWAIINFVAIVATTSRSAMIGAILLIVYLLWTMRKSRMLLLICGGLLLALFIYLNLDVLLAISESQTNLLNRIFKIQDRLLIWNAALEFMSVKPLIGLGAISFEAANVSSFHNSYFESIIRYGIVGFIVWLLMLLPTSLYRTSFSKGYICILATFLIAAFFNNILRHPHLFMMYSVWALNAKQINERLTR